MVVELDEIESTIQKVNLATKLHCAPSDLTTHTMECQSDKIGRVIGRQGATIKMLEQQYHVSMDVDSVAAKIHLTGSADAITAAVVEIENIINSVDVDVTMEKHVLGYLTSKVCVVNRFSCVSLVTNGTMFFLTTHTLFSASMPWPTFVRHIPRLPWMSFMTRSTYSSEDCHKM